jgi:hypothetical protein
MSDRELTQLISTAKFYLDAADSLHLSEQELASKVSDDSANWPTDRVPHNLSSLDTFSAHLASCATRLATIHEILTGVGAAWDMAYPNDAELTDPNVRSAIENAFEILVRDNVGHSEEDPSGRGKRKAPFRKAVLAPLTFSDMQSHLRRRYQTLRDNLIRFA